jgi:hypothetical protein
LQKNCYAAVRPFRQVPWACDPGLRVLRSSPDWSIQGFYVRKNPHIIRGRDERARVLSPGQHKLESFRFEFFFDDFRKLFYSFISRIIQMNKSLALAAIVAAVALAACGKKEEAPAPAPVVVTPAPAPAPVEAASAPAPAADASAPAAAASAPAAGTTAAPVDAGAGAGTATSGTGEKK